jgi:hypothetical protein
MKRCIRETTPGSPPGVWRANPGALRNWSLWVRVGLVLAGWCGPAWGGMSVYHDLSAWQAACPVYEVETFTDTALNPGLTVDTDNGHIDTVRGVWADSLVTNPPATTTWNFDATKLGFGALWDLAGPGGVGASIRVFLDDELVGEEILATTNWGFWGVVSTRPFNSVHLTTGSTPGWRESYEMDNLMYGVPEPVSLALLATGGLLVLGRRRAARLT